MGFEDKGTNLRGGLAATLAVSPSGHTISPHPSSREGHHATVWWSTRSPYRVWPQAIAESPTPDSRRGKESSADSYLRARPRYPRTLLQCANRAIAEGRIWRSGQSLSVSTGTRIQL